MADQTPFIGQAYSFLQKKFLGTCVPKSSVSSLNYGNGRLDVEIDLNYSVDSAELGRFLKIQELNARDKIYIVVGIDVQFQRENTAQYGFIRANIPNFEDDPQICLNRQITVEFSEQQQFIILRYYLIPIKFICQLSQSYPVKKKNCFNPKDMKKWKIFKDYNDCIQSANDLTNDEEFLSVMPIDVNCQLKLLQKTLIRSQEDFFLRRFLTLRELQADDNWCEILNSLNLEIETCRQRAESSCDKVKTIRKTLKGKILFKNSLKGHGIDYVDQKGFNKAIGAEDCFALIFNEELVAGDISHFKETIRFLKEFVSEEKRPGTSQAFIAVDLDVIPKYEFGFVIPKKVAIYHFSKNQPVSFDLVSDAEMKIKFSIAKCQKRGDGPEPEQRGKFKCPCPNSFGGSCSGVYQEWFCEKCETVFEYGYNDHIYCKCKQGKGTRLEEFEFRCIHLGHGSDYVKYNVLCSNHFDEIIPMENRNVLILGPVGVGKSAMINGFLNYVHLNLSFPIAEKQRKLTAILETRKDPFQICNISYDKDGETYNIRLIDTPGLGDADCVDQDEKNMQKVLKFVKNFEELHAICIVLKANDSDIGMRMKYCITEILSNFHKNWAGNIIFLFTNARPVNYQPGSTLRLLREILDGIEVHISLDCFTVYSFDNEAYGCLCSLKRNRGEYSTELKHIEESWRRSVDETGRFFDYVIDDLKPVKIRESLLLNDSKKLILCLKRAITDITLFIELKIQNVSDRKKLAEEITGDKEKAVVNQIMNLRAEKIAITAILQKLSFLLQKHAIIPYNDCLIDFLNLLIDSKENDPSEGKRKILDRLLKHKKTVEEEVKFLKTAMADASSDDVNLSDVDKLKEELCGLPVYGKQISQIMKTVEEEGKAVKKSEKNRNLAENNACAVKVKPCKDAKNELTRNNKKGVSSNSVKKVPEYLSWRKEQENRDFNKTINDILNK